MPPNKSAWHDKVWGFLCKAYLSSTIRHRMLLSFAQISSVFTAKKRSTPSFCKDSFATSPALREGASVAPSQFKIKSVQ
jgi:hypothetical protein